MSDNTMIVKIEGGGWSFLINFVREAVKQRAIEQLGSSPFTVTDITDDHLSRREVERVLDEVECVAQKPGEFSGREMFKRGATDAVIGVRNRLFSDASKPEAEEIIKHMASKEELALGAWMSAALEDDTVCAEMKTAINNWFDTLILPKTTEAEAIDSLRRRRGK